MEEQIKIQTTIMRGGTSKAVFLKENHVPKNQEERDKLLLALFGSPDKRQIDGLGGADFLTSKCAIIGPTTHPEADVNYTFAQVSITEPVVSYDINCGNISTAVGVYAIEEGFVRPVEPITSVRVYNTNTDKILIIKVPVKNGKPMIEGDFKIDGVPGTGAEVALDFSRTVGSATGKLLPTGNVKDKIFVKSLGKNIDVSIVDVANLCVFFRAEDVGLKGTEKPDEVTDEQFRLFEEIRQVVAEMCELSKSNYLLPFQVAIKPPTDYEVFSTGRTISADEVDFVARLFLDNTMHKAYPGTGSSCTAVAAQIEGTIVHEASSHHGNPRRVRIGHPSGVIPIFSNVQKDKDWEVKEVLFSRTARRIMEGYAYVPRWRLK